MGVGTETSFRHKKGLEELSNPFLLEFVGFTWRRQRGGAR
jgi:hypothetical protein